MPQALPGPTGTARSHRTACQPGTLTSILCQPSFYFLSASFHITFTSLMATHCHSPAGPSHSHHSWPHTAIHLQAPHIHITHGHTLPFTCRPLTFTSLMATHCHSPAGPAVHTLTRSVPLNQHFRSKFILI